MDGIGVVKKHLWNTLFFLAQQPRSKNQQILSSDVRVSAFSVTDPGESLKVSEIMGR